MAITGVMKSGLMQLRVLNLEESVKFYTEVLGLYEVCRTDDGRVCFKAYDEFEHHSLTLRQADKAGMDFLAFKVQDDEYLDKLADATRAFGLPCEFVAPNSDQPGYGRRLAVHTPTGHRIDLYAHSEFSEPQPGLFNPEIWVQHPHGIGVQCFDHALLFGPNSKETVRYFTDVLGLSKVEVAKTPDGDGDLCTWLTGANRTHDVAVLEFPEAGKLHHVGYKLGSWEEIGHAADLMTINNVIIDAGPMRHGVTRGQTIYFFDPSGNRLETFAGGYAYYPDMPLRVWDFEHVGKGIFYYTRMLNDNFLNVVT
ncbi:MAG: catechol 2,3-dioxygenase [Oscillospiraceae bacterium]|nr:catechol 2,3-dioxygenase [Oscillospiraceae bacterium]